MKLLQKHFHFHSYFIVNVSQNNHFKSNLMGSVINLNLLKK